MERRTALRAQVDLHALALVDGFDHSCRVVDLSTTGMVVERTKSLAARGTPEMNSVEIRLTDGRHIRTRARTVWSRDRLQAVRFVVMHDVDRLAIAEQLDQRARRNEPLH
jgi:hypothetical protein